ncbi:hypothetical protein HY639_03900 [Candidatus Woesearchaeota archaeon]|nr:hypothetical protein [Candidatus Woesearchaeota archaeon]
MNKKGIFFTFMCFLLVLLVIAIFATQRNITLQYKQPVTLSRTHTLNEFYQTLDRAVLPDVLRISSVQAFLAVTRKIKDEKRPHPIEPFDAIVRGTNADYDLHGNGADAWLQKIKQWAQTTYHLDRVELDFLPGTIAVIQREPWTVEVSAMGKVTLIDRANKIGFETTKKYTVTIPIEGLPDQLWAQKGVDRNITSILQNVTMGGKWFGNISTDLVVWEQLVKGSSLRELAKDERLAILNLSITQGAYFHPSTVLAAPNYLQRFGGTGSDAKTGIFSFADAGLQDKVGVANARQSYLDYKFIWSKLPVGQLDYAIGLSAIDGLITEMKGSPPRPVTTEFHITGLADGYRFKMDADDRKFLALEIPVDFHCKDDVDETQPLPIFADHECFYGARELGEPLATFTQTVS